MKRYNPKEIEPRWQKSWADSKIYQAKEDSTQSKRYVLEYFPYPSGAAMHVGHVRNYTIGDTVSRFNRMKGHNVLHPMGWDAFGLPAENYAIKTGVSPQETIKESTKKFKQQLMQIGTDYDWSREINSSDPKYYKWTQWFFLLLFKKGLAYRKESLQWWCPVDKTVLANEQVENGKCWRCGSEVEKKALPQWFFKITEYADRLIKDLDDVDWSNSIKIQQRNWIGRSTGAEIAFKIDGTEDKISVFTTRHDTQYGVTFLVLAPEHPLVTKITSQEYKGKVDDYINRSLAKSDLERQQDEKQKTGQFTGAYATNPANQEKIPIWIADYVLWGYGTGAVMGVPAHDDRDNEFAKKYNLPIVRVLETDNYTDFHSEGVVINSDKYDGMRSETMREKILADFIKSGVAEEKVNYKIRDWLISRQRYWGAPIPIIHCPKDGPVPVPEADLPVVLPEVKSYEPSGDGRSPLALVEEFVNVKCPKCGGDAERETDTMDGFACSSWYFLRFADPHNDKQPFDPKKTEFWLPVDDYIGGAEHAVMHLLYARFWTKVMYDEGLISFKEPFTSLRNQGMILAPDGQKMSKSKGNTIEPDELISQGYGADSIRIMELFIGPWNQAASWSIEGIGGCFRFLQRVWTLTQEFMEADKKEGSSDERLLKLTHQAIYKVSKDLEEMGFNTAIATLMETTNQLYKIKAEKGFADESWNFAIETVVQLLAPFAPHIAEQLWADLGHEESVHISKWPVHDEKYLISDNITIVVQVNGRVRANLIMPSDSSEEEIIAAAKRDAKVAEYINKKKLRKTIYVPAKLVNFVV